MRKEKWENKVLWVLFAVGQSLLGEIIVFQLTSNLKPEEQFVQVALEVELGYIFFFSIVFFANFVEGAFKTGDSFVSVGVEFELSLTLELSEKTRRFKEEFQ